MALRQKPTRVFEGIRDEDCGFSEITVTEVVSALAIFEAKTDDKLICQVKRVKCVYGSHLDQDVRIGHTRSVRRSP